MLRALSLFVLGVCADVLVGLPAFAQSPAEVTLTRIDCGTGATPTDVGQRFTDTFAYKDLKLTFTFSCYLIKHGDEWYGTPALPLAQVPTRRKSASSIA